MPDLIFEDPRLVSIYDVYDGHRTDLDHYANLIAEMGAKTILDIGCGTGCLVELLSSRGLSVIGVEPAKASLDFARNKVRTELVQWLHGDATTLPPMQVDLAIMTGNVAQVFLTDLAWLETLNGIHKSLRPDGRLVFEVRDPARRAWLDWTREKTFSRLDIPGAGLVESWCQVNDVSNDIVSFTWTYVFESDGQVFKSESKLRFRSRDAIAESLKRSGYILDEVRDAPDRPGREFIFIASRLG